MDEVTRARKSLEWLKERLDMVNAKLDSNAVWLAIQLLKKLQWRSYSDDPPEGKKTILLWVDYKMGGFATTAHLEADGTVWWWSYNGKMFLDDPSTALWMDITEPE